MPSHSAAQEVCLTDIDFPSCLQGLGMEGLPTMNLMEVNMFADGMLTQDLGPTDLPDSDNE